MKVAIVLSLTGLSLLVLAGCSGSGGAVAGNPFSGVVSKGAGVSGIPGDAYSAALSSRGSALAFTAYDSTNPEVYNGTETEYTDNIDEEDPEDIFADGYPTHDYVRLIYDQTMSDSAIYYTSNGYVDPEGNHFTGAGLSRLTVTGTMSAAVGLPDSGSYLCALIQNGPLYVYSVSANQATIELRNPTTLGVTGTRSLGSGFSFDTAIDMEAAPESSNSNVILYTLGLKDGKARVARTSMDFSGIATSTQVEVVLPTNELPVSLAVDDQFFYVAYSNAVAHTSHIDVYSRVGAAFLTSLVNEDCQEITSIASIHSGGNYAVYADAREAIPSSGASVSALFKFE